MSFIERNRGIIALVLTAALVAGGALLVQRWPQPAAIAIIVPTPTPTATPAPVIVHVAGAVAQPGVYALPPASRLALAVQMAGGLTADADGERLNLASRLQDGQQVYVPRKGEALPEAAEAVRGGQTTAIEQQGGAELININAASATELEQLPGIGAVLAARIVADRQANGPFANVQALDRVEGIGPATCERLAPLICTQ